MNVLAIDPGNVLSGWCILDDQTLEPLNVDKSLNDDVLALLENREGMTPPDMVVIERVASYGMAVGKEVFLTCEWIGRFAQKAEDLGIPVDYLYRRQEKLHICGDSRAKDGNIRIALIDRFAKHDTKNGKGTKKNPDWFYGFRADIWQAYALGIVFIETKLNG